MHLGGGLKWSVSGGALSVRSTPVNCHPRETLAQSFSHRENSQCRCCGDRRSPLFQKWTTATVPGVGWTEARQGKHMEAETLWGNWEDEQGEEVETQEVAGRKEGKGKGRSGVLK